MNEDINTVSPTLGFIIKTIDYEGYLSPPIFFPIPLSYSSPVTKSWHQPPNTPRSYKLNIWDVGGQKTLRSYWRNYFEKTDALIWVVDSTDRVRVGDCAEELAGLLQEEVRPSISPYPFPSSLACLLFSFHSKP